MTTHRGHNIDGGTFTCERLNGGDLAGGYVCEAFRHGQRLYMRYLYYSKREVVARFKSYLAGE